MTRIEGEITGHQIKMAKICFGLQEEPSEVIKIKITIPYSMQLNRDLGQLYRKAIHGEIDSVQIPLTEEGS